MWLGGRKSQSENCIYNKMPPDYRKKARTMQNVNSGCGTVAVWATLSFLALSAFLR